MKKIFSYLSPLKFKMVLQFFIKFTGTIMDLFLPWILSHLIDEVVPTKDIKLVFFWGGIMIICAIIGISFNIIANHLATGISRTATRQIRHDLFTKISYLSASQVDKYTLPSLLSRLTSDTYYVHQLLDRMQRIGVRAPIILIGGLIVTFSIEPVLTLTIVTILPLIIFVVLFISKRGIPLYSKTQSSVDKLVRKIQETMSGIRVIKALSKEEYEKDCFDEINKDVVKNEQRAGVLMNISNPTMQFLLNLGLTLVVILGAYRVNDGIIKAGIIVAFLSYFTIILNSMLILTRIFIIFSKGVASGKRIAEVLELEDDLVFPALKSSDDSLTNQNNALDIKKKKEQENPGNTDKQDSDIFLTDTSPFIDKADFLNSLTPEYFIEFEAVSFSYNKKYNNVENISFKLKKGETLGIIGATGSGKSIVISLLLRFYDADEGLIKINGIPINMIPSEILYTLFGVVFQNDFILADTIYENIDFGRKLTKEQIESAANYAQASYISNKKGGFNHELTIKGSNLSGGQKQRLLIARALAAKPDILILDDSQSALDFITDANLRRALFENFSTTTSVIIASRVSSILNANHILVLDGGKIIGSGTHNELLETCPNYKEIYDIQMGGSHD